MGDSGNYFLTESQVCGSFSWLLCDFFFYSFIAITLQVVIWDFQNLLISQFDWSSMAPIKKKI
jgi:hypothetical protein